MGRLPEGHSRTILVTGMHRSGTSVVARAVQLLGVSLGDPGQLLPAGPDNPAGYWENGAIKEFNDELLAHLGGSWDQPPVLSDGWEASPDLHSHKIRAVEILERAFGPEGSHEPAIGFKDPRLSLLLPFWTSVTPVHATIVVVRDPYEVAASLEARNAIPAPQSALLWLRYLLAATRDGPRPLILKSADLFDDLPSTLDLIAGHLDLAPPTEDAVVSVDRHLDRSLHHHRHTQEKGSPGKVNPLMELADAVWSGGAVKLDVLPIPLLEALASGWLRPPSDGEALARARAKVVKLQETMRRRVREIQRLRAESSAPMSAPVPPPPE